MISAWDVCFISIKYEHSGHDSTQSAKWERNFGLLLLGTAAFPSRSEELNWFSELQTTSNLWNNDKKLAASGQSGK